MRKTKKQKKHHRVKGKARYIAVPTKSGNPSSQTKWQILKFAIVGGLATATHAGIFAFVIETQLAQALEANFIAFAVAFLISFLGQYHWTFRNSSDTHWSKKMTKFLIVALIGLGLNTAGVLVIVERLLLPYHYAILFMVTVVPVTTFIINKKWAFS
ncbi:GtrA family protein [Methylomonas sp. EFPC3]|uniref:GtrA family protein n=1 Tax=Methylomonas sp. EFPC3 TaxID=3021710 RepID=UPI002418004C|nr:GtrA family protein [Methylomonas sp. EFPC3]WFP49056.1 GtrA family protein [Methylomonas sp. EFPC3]